MAQFSIKEAVKFSFVSYGRHLALLLSASAIVGGSFWFATVAPRYVSQKLGIEHHLIRQDTDIAGISYDEAKVDPSIITQRPAEGIFGRISARPLESVALILVTFFVWALFLFLLLGCMKLGLTIVDKNSGLLCLLFQISARQMMRFIGASLIFWLSLSIPVGALGMSLFTFMMMYPPKPIAIMVGLVLGVCVMAVFFWSLRFIFYGYCIVDKPRIGMFDALSMSITITDGSRWRIVASLCIFAVLAWVVRYIINASLVLSGSVEVMKYGIKSARFVCILVIMPFFIPYFSYIYRSLTRKA